MQTDLQDPPRLPRPWRGLLLAPFLGVLAGAGQAPLDLWYVAFPAIVLVTGVFAATRKPWAAGLIGWFFGLGYFGFSMRWIVEPFQVEADLYGWMAPFALAGLAAGLALFWALAFWGAKRLGRLWPLVPLWALAEFARGYLLTGLPWAMPAYIWADSLAIHYVAFTGPYGLNALTVLLAAAMVYAWPRKGLGAIALQVLLPGLFVGGALWIAPQAVLPEPRGPVIRLVQPNAPQTEKWRQDRIPVFLERQIAATAAGEPADLVVWPETALPMLLEDAGEVSSVIAEAARGAPVVVGVQRREGMDYFNALAVIGAEGETVAVFDKHHLVPFGEYMPFASLFARFNIFGLAARARTGYASGPGPSLLPIEGVGKALPLICYEAVFPQYGRVPGDRADVLLQITNDAWFGDYAGPYQHLAQARIRAIEQGIPLVRAANTGISAAVDGQGRVLGQLPLGEAGYLDIRLPAALDPTYYARTGDLTAFVSLIFLLLVAIWTKRRNMRLQRGGVRPQNEH